ncbi:MAG TPA: hypothetical protein VNS63_06810 [Blastocatellia bacterium]|nr:hypothetical protein [Blastocatellia bacterium]
MRKSKIRKAAEAAVDNIDRQSGPALDLATAEPDLLRNSVREALSQLSTEERAAVNDRLLTAIEKVGFTIGQHLLLLGIPATLAEELTAPEIAALIRYVRINEPRAMRALVPLLSELLTAHGEGARTLGLFSCAA